MTPVLEISGLSFSWAGSTIPVIEALCLCIEEGDFVIIKGSSGSGKSTLLRLVCRLEQLRSGVILYRGEDIASLAPSVLRSAVRYVAQVPQMVEGTVEENLLLPFAFEVNALKKRPERDVLMKMLEEFHLGSLKLEQSAMKLSLGQKQRLALMRAILQDPDILLLDEPTSALDRKNAGMVNAIIERLNVDRKKTLLLVTHADYHAEKASPKTFVLQNRRLTGES